jgi:hypothetical protein
MHSLSRLAAGEQIVTLAEQVTKDEHDPTRFSVHTSLPARVVPVSGSLVLTMVASCEGEVNAWMSTLAACIAYSEALQGARATWIGGEYDKLEERLRGVDECHRLVHDLAAKLAVHSDSESIPAVARSISARFVREDVDDETSLVQRK